MSITENKQLQRALRENTGLVITIDGVLGNQTETALAAFMKTTGTERPQAMDLLHRYMAIRYVTSDAFTQAAKMLTVPESYVRAIAEVETVGDSFLKDGRVKILFERHWFIRKLREAMVSVDVRKNVAIYVGSGQFAEPRSIDILMALVEKKYENICSTTRGGYLGNEKEWDRLNLAMNLDVEAAAQSASFGGFQLMGFNFKACGYANAKTMMLDMAVSESKQFLAMVAFIKANPSIQKALKMGDWAGVANGYNGSAYKENKYDTKLAAAELGNRTYNLA